MLFDMSDDKSQPSNLVISNLNYQFPWVQRSKHFDQSW
jgi:hypothetical protein